MTRHQSDFNFDAIKKMADWDQTSQVQRPGSTIDTYGTPMVKNTNNGNSAASTRLKTVPQSTYEKHDSDQRENNRIPKETAASEPRKAEPPLESASSSTLKTSGRSLAQPVLIPFNREKFESDYVLLQDVIDKLKLNSEIDFPEIVVLGQQSEGKSTLLEALAKVKLPKGDGMCTKCLIRLCIRKKLEEETSITISLSGHPDISGIKSEELPLVLNGLMSTVVQTSSSGVSMETVINVRCSGPNQVDLTVTDVPGFTEQIKEDQLNMQAVDKLISKPNTIMVVVLKAVNDIETSIGYTLARKFDPDGKRTILVLTHCDNLAENKQQMVRNMIVNKDAFAVHCFSSTGEYSSAEEKELFSEPFWKELPQSNLGIDALAEKLAKTLYAVIAPQKDESREKLRRLWLSEESKHKRLLEEKENMKVKTKKLLHEVAKEIEAHLVGLHTDEKNQLFSDCRTLWTKTLDNELVKISQEIRTNLEAMIAEEYKDQRGSEFSSLVYTFPVLKRIINQFMTEFEPVMIELIDKIEVIILKFIQSILEKRLKDNEHLLKFVTASIGTYSLELRADVEEKMKSVLEMEKVVYRRECQTQETQSISSPENARKSDAARANDPLWIQTGQSNMLHEENHKKVLLKESETYLKLAEDRMAVTIPKAIVQFMLKRLADDFYGCITQKISPDVRGNMHQAITSKAEMLKKSIEEINILLNRF